MTTNIREWDEGYTKTEWFDLAVPFPTKPFETYDDFELFIFSNGIGFFKDEYEDFIEWCAEKYLDLTGIDVFELPLNV